MVVNLNRKSAACCEPAEETHIYLQSDIRLGEMFAENEGTFTFAQFMFHSVQVVEDELAVLFVRFLIRSEAGLFESAILSRLHRITNITDLVNAIVEVVVDPYVLLFDFTFKRWWQKPATRLVCLTQLLW